MNSSVGMGRVLGVPLRIHWTVPLLVMLFGYSLGSHTLPAGVPDQPNVIYTVAGLAGALSLLVSLPPALAQPTHPGLHRCHLARVRPGQPRGRPGELVHHADHGTQYTSIKLTTRLVRAGVPRQPSEGRCGSLCRLALATCPEHSVS
jgi:hypothetical protein